jgi:murein L,D-transpeptidase YcbB/YkuD
MPDRLKCLCGLLFWVLLAGPSLVSAAESPTFAEGIEAKIREIQDTGQLVVGQRTIYAHRFVDGLYAKNGNRPLWNKAGQDAFLTAMEGLSADGLDPKEYVFPEIGRYFEKQSQGSLSPLEQLELDILLTEGLVRAMYNLAYGKVDPLALDSNFNFAQPLGGVDISPLLVRHIPAGEIAALLDRARPKHPAYARLRDALEQYRVIQANGGWPAIPDGKALKPGDQDSRIPQLRERLAITGDYESPQVPDEEQTLDEPLEQALKRFQDRHGLTADGVLGKKTLAALNVPVAQRIDQIRVNLERQRWYLHEIEGEFIIVDIAGFQAFWMKDDERVWQQVVQVGKEYTATPIFKDEIEYLDFNPTWTIPPGIIKRSILPNLKKDPGYLGKKGYLLLTLEGKEVDPQTVDWTNLKGFPYMVRQPAGPDNALGQVKFMFPNPHFVFLHDTNHRELFDRERRTFSSGCIRVKDPFDLAERLLRGQDGWDRSRIDETIASGKTTRVNLEKPMRIIIAYATAFAREDSVRFREDIYNRDAGVLKALDGGFTIRKQDR